MGARLDLNLMQALDALLRERNVSRAAARLGIGQPAMSAALARLRLLFDDPLFVRTPRGMEPTPRALRAAGPLGGALAELRGLVEPSEVFDPATARRTFRVSGGDYAAMVLLPGLLRTLEREAPGVDLRYRFVEKGSVLACLDEEEIDLALCVMEDLPKRFACETVLTDTFVCVVRRGHPLEGAPLTLDGFLAQTHILVTERGDERGAVDAMLEGLGRARRLVLTVPQVSLVPMVLAGSDAVATMARCAAEQAARLHPITLLEPPFAMPPWRIRMVWSTRRNRDEGLHWLRRTILAAARPPG